MHPYTKEDPMDCQEYASREALSRTSHVGAGWWQSRAQEAEETPCCTYCGITEWEEIEVDRTRGINYCPRCEHLYWEERALEIERDGGPDWDTARVEEDRCPLCGCEGRTEYSGAVDTATDRPWSRGHLPIRVEIICRACGQTHWAEGELTRLRED